MNHPTESGHKQIKPGSQPRPKMPSNPTVQQMKGWDKDELLWWIQQKKPTLLSGRNLERFIAAEILGEGFLWAAGDVDPFMKAGLPFGVSQGLAILGHEVKEGGNLSNQIPDRRRKVDSEQAGLAEPPDAASKRRRLDSEVNAELAKRARERRDHIREKIEALGLLPDNADQLPDNADQLPNAVVQLSNPAFHTKLPFPFVGPVVPTRFPTDPDSEDNWFYMGREMFVRLLNKLKYVRKARNRSALWVYGTKGYGKSHLLAALVCYLAAQEEPVVYIPDCRECVKSPVEYLQASMLFAWADDKTMQDEIITLDTQEKIERFFKRHPDAIIFIDQLNGCEGMEWEDHPTRKRKGEIKQWLESCRVRHTAILSTSANYKSYLETAPKQNTEETIYAYGGFTKTEMEQWWERNKDVMESDVVRGGYTKNDIEDLTGKIPLLLDNCVVKDEKDQPFAIDLGTKFLFGIYEQAMMFEQQIRSKYIDNWRDLDRHNTYMKACLFGLRVIPSSIMIPQLVDHRYFFDEFDKDQHANIAHYACGIARNAVATELLANKVNLSDRDFWSSLPEHINNPCTTRFIIEQAILSRISFSGLNIAGKDINTSMSVVLFSGNFPKFRTDITGQPILYYPQKFNYRGIDGIIIRIGPQPMTKENRQQLFVYPLQITLTPDTHSDSHKTFFNDYESWIYSLEEYDVVLTFLWISPKVAGPKLHNPTDEDDWPAHYEEYVPINQVDSNLWALYMHAKQRQQIQRAPEPPARGDGQGRIEKQGVSEKPEGLGEQMRLDGPSAAAGPSGGEARGSRESRSGGRGGDDRKVYQSRTVAELRLELKSRVLRHTGKKNDLINRLVEHDRTRGTPDGAVDNK